MRNEDCGEEYNEQRHERSDLNLWTNTTKAAFDAKLNLNAEEFT